MISNIIVLSTLALQSCHFVFAQDDCKRRDCVDLQCYGLLKAKDGPHTVYPDTDTEQPLQVSCDQIKLEDGWLIFQRRVFGGVLNFTRLWAGYRNGFRDQSVLRLGNEHVHQIISGYGTTKCEAYFKTTAYDYTSCYAVIPEFKLDNETRHYTVRFGGTINAVRCWPTYFSNIANRPLYVIPYIRSPGNQIL